jgi:hypothetical protein
MGRNASRSPDCLSERIQLGHRVLPCRPGDDCIVRTAAAAISSRLGPAGHSSLAVTTTARTIYIGLHSEIAPDDKDGPLVLSSSAKIRGVDPVAVIDRRIELETFGQFTKMLKKPETMDFLIHV